MLQDEEYDSDSSDEDYKPGGESDVSEEEGDGDPEEPLVGDDAESKKQTGKRKKKQTSRPRKRKGIVLEGEEAEKEAEKDVENEELKKQMKEEEERKKEEAEKQKANDLFASFLKDVGGPRPRPKAGAGSIAGGLASVTTSTTAKPQQKPEQSATSKVTVTKVFDFAGETVTVTKEVDANSREAKRAAPPSSASPAAAPGAASASSQGGRQVAAPRRAGGLAGLVQNLGKAPKMSVLEKSKLDWDGFKKDEKLESELEQYKRSKDAYLDKRDFLERADLRQFELEKALRDRHRTPR